MKAIIKAGIPRTKKRITPTIWSKVIDKISDMATFNHGIIVVSKV
jgi:hypothetical protein